MRSDPLKKRKNCSRQKSFVVVNVFGTKKPQQYRIVATGWSKTHLKVFFLVGFEVLPRWGLTPHWPVFQRFWSCWVSKRFVKKEFRHAQVTRPSMSADHRKTIPKTQVMRETRGSNRSLPPRSPVKRNWCKRRLAPQTTVKLSVGLSPRFTFCVSCFFFAMLACFVVTYWLWSPTKTQTYVPFLSSRGTKTNN